MQSYKVHGKWILAGEHAVLRGVPALVFPISSKYLELDYQANDEDFSVDFESKGNDLHIGFWAVFEKALELLSMKRCDLKGKMSLRNNIPIGAGMGASATLCVAVTKFFHSLGKIPEKKIFTFAKELEDLFHGKSSGVDIAVALYNKPLAFRAPDEIEDLSPKWRPHFYLSYCGKRGVTVDCVKKVEKLFEEKPGTAESIDKNMQQAVFEAMNSLEKQKDLMGLGSAIERAEQCFEDWHLVSDALSEHMNELRKAGALAVKPTGSGDGGYVLSLWEREVGDEKLPFDMIPCN